MNQGAGGVGKRSRHFPPPSRRLIDTFHVGTTLDADDGIVYRIHLVVRVADSLHFADGRTVTEPSGAFIQLDGLSPAMRRHAELYLSAERIEGDDPLQQLSWRDLPDATDWLRPRRKVKGSHSDAWVGLEAISSAVWSGILAGDDALPRAFGISLLRGALRAAVTTGRDEALREVLIASLEANAVKVAIDAVDLMSEEGTTTASSIADVLSRRARWKDLALPVLVRWERLLRRDESESPERARALALLGLYWLFHGNPQRALALFRTSGVEPGEVDRLLRELLEEILAWGADWRWLADRIAESIADPHARLSALLTVSKSLNAASRR